MSISDSISHRRAEGEFAARLDDLIEPAWWDGTPALAPERFTIDCAEYGLADSDPSGATELGDRMRATFDEIGLVHLVNTGLTELASMRGLARHVLQTEMSYAAGANPRDRMEPNVYEVGAPLSAWLHYHHEMAYVATSTMMLAFLCAEPLPGRGATFVSDNVQVTDALLATDFGRKLQELGICYHRAMSDREAFEDRQEIGVYNHWQKSLGTEDPGEAEARARARGLLTEWGPDRLLKTRFYVSAFEYFAPLDRNLLYSSVADHGMWFDAWPLVMHLPYAERPLHLTFGDDTELTRDELRQFVGVYDRFGIQIDWRRGDVGLVCNHRFAHGRPAVEVGDGEDRKLGVMLGEAYRRVGALPDKW